jgi:hypothetical protein
MSELRPIKDIVKKVMNDIINIAGDAYEALSDEEAEFRRMAFISDPETGLSVDRFSDLMGKKYADKYFDKVFQSLKYRDISASLKLKNCVCTYRKKLNKDYVCYGMRCPFKADRPLRD